MNMTEVASLDREKEENEDAVNRLFEGGRINQTFQKYLLLFNNMNRSARVALGDAKATEGFGAAVGISIAKDYLKDLARHLQDCYPKDSRRDNLYELARDEFNKINQQINRIDPHGANIPKN